MKHRITIAIPIAVFGALVFVSPAAAQRGIGAKAAPLGRPAWGGSFGMGGRGAFRPAHPPYPFYRARGRGRGWGPGWGWGYLQYPDYYSEYEPAMTEAPPWESAGQPLQPPPPERQIHPILLERQGNQWVLVTGYSPSPAYAQPAPPETAEAAPRRTALPSPDEATEPPLPPAVLVFRDGHEEEVKSYTIIGTTLYTSANYWASGSWTRKIEIANLDVPATLKLNQQRGSEFSLPSRPQEVMMRP